MTVAIERWYIYIKVWYRYLVCYSAKIVKHFVRVNKDARSALAFYRSTFALGLGPAVGFWKEMNNGAGKGLGKHFIYPLEIVIIYPLW